MATDLYITDHAAGRFKSRAGLPKRTVAKYAAIALERGIAREDATGQLRRYFDMLYLRQQTANNIRIYSGKVYIFRFGTLITVLNLPGGLQKSAQKAQRKKDDAEGNTP